MDTYSVEWQNFNFKHFQAELDIMVRNVDNLLVLFHDRKKKSQKALNALEHIDDDTDRIGVSFVEVDDIKA